jgi:hypothetical protein
MAVIRYHLVKVSTVGQLSGQKAVIELDDANRLIVTHLDPATGAKQDIVMDVPFSDLRIKRSQNQLTLITPTATHKVDFAPGSTTALLAGGAIGMLVHSAVTGPNDLAAWIKEFEARGVTVSKWNAFRIACVVFLGIFVVLVATMVVTGWGTS